ncbi:MAG: radical SAM protein [Deltaproteobacteria bacterium]|nr:radical SAM protein [Deltaproteobacteria bacterium]
MDEVRVSLAAAMTLDLEPGLFYRGARLGCINLLQTHESGCSARCAYCGLTREREGDFSSKGFIRVKWPTLPFPEVLDAMEKTQERFSRICISMITRRGAAGDLVGMARRVRERLDTPLSGLISPTVTSADDLASMREAGIDRLGIAVDTATPELFDAMRGRSIRGPHRWKRYWEVFREALEVFGAGMVGCHLICGLGESEREMAERIQFVRDMGGCTHLFSFYPELGSPLEDREQSPVGQYRRIQVARHLIDEGLAEAGGFRFDGDGRIVSFGVDDGLLEEVVSSGTPFRTSGCPGRDGCVACNRPFANSRPGPDMRNYPFPLEADDVSKVIEELWS